MSFHSFILALITLGQVNLINAADENIYRFESNVISDQSDTRCYYRGNQGSESAALKICNGKVEGVVKRNGKTYSIIHEKGQHKIYDVNLDEQDGGICDLTGSSAVQAHEGDVLQQTLPDLYIEYIMVLDNDSIHYLNQNNIQAVEYGRLIIDLAEYFLGFLNPRLKLVAKDVITLPKGDEFPPGHNVAQHLENFKDYAQKNIYPGNKYDVIQLIIGKLIKKSTGVDIVEGRAFPFELCKPRSVGVAQFRNKWGQIRNNLNLITIMVHEMAHNMGLGHNEDYPIPRNCKCSGSKGCIMDKENKGSLTWSQCSIVKMEQVLAGSTKVDVQCLRNIPMARVTTTSSTAAAPSTVRKTDPSSAETLPSRATSKTGPTGSISSSKLTTVASTTAAVQVSKTESTKPTGIIMVFLVILIIAAIIGYYLTKNSTDNVHPIDENIYEAISPKINCKDQDYCNQIEVTFVANGKQFHVYANRNTDPRYHSKSNPDPRCYYHGNQGSDSAGMKICNGQVEGLVKQNGKTFKITFEGGQHKIYDVNLEKQDGGPRDVSQYDGQRAVRKRELLQQTISQMYIEYILVLDRDMIEHCNKNEDEAIQYGERIFNSAAYIMHALSPRLKLVSKDIITLPKGNEFPRGYNVSQHLENFKDYAIKNIYPVNQYDAIQLIIGRVIRTYSNNKLQEGHAYHSELCKPKSVGVVQYEKDADKSRSDLDMARLIAHELGHTMGLIHNQQYPKASRCMCSDPKGCIMDYENNGSSLWSQCSKDAMRDTLAGSTKLDMTCLHNIPVVKPTTSSKTPATSSSNATSRAGLTSTSKFITSVAIKPIITIITIISLFLVMIIITAIICYYLKKYSRDNGRQKTDRPNVESPKNDKA
ncbi:Snake venom metalloproteinase BjussuMP-2 [Halotydeus destructor]|nr:Snake venom metalloproteinase BjussuMP-2 [Halotydeus destructor]